MVWGSKREVIVVIFLAGNWEITEVGVGTNTAKFGMRTEIPKASPRLYGGLRALLAALLLLIAALLLNRSTPNGMNAKIAIGVNVAELGVPR